MLMSDISTSPEVVTVRNDETLYVSTYYSYSALFYDGKSRKSSIFSATLTAGVFLFFASAG